MINLLRIQGRTLWQEKQQQLQKWWHMAIMEVMETDIFDQKRIAYRSLTCKCKE